MTIAIIGTRGIPNAYGGFEQFAEYISVGLVDLGHKVTVYNSHKHPYKDKTYKGVDIVHCKDPEHRIGTVGQFIYDLNCILDTRKKNFDIILQLGYTSSSIWSGLFPKKVLVTTNMDGLEWKRTKYSKPVQKFLLLAERLAIKHSDYLIADSIGIKNYIREKYQKNPVYIPYGANVFSNPDETVLKKYKVKAFQYNMLIARLEPENSIEIILDGVVTAKQNAPFLVIGKNATRYGEFLKQKYKEHANIQFTGSIYDITTLNNLRHYSNLYFHGHTVGGTNPSLLEAMASQALICANDNIFNRSVLGNDAYYFNEANDIADVITKHQKQNNKLMIINNEQKISQIYSWKIIINKYLNHFEDIIGRKKTVP